MNGLPDGFVYSGLTATGPSLLGMLWQYRRVVTLAMLLGVIAAAALSGLQPVRYEAVTRVVLPDPVRDPESGQPTADPSRALLNQATLLGSRPVLEGAARLYDPALPADEIGARVRIVASKRADAIDIRAFDATPEGAVRLADAMLASYDEVAAKEAERIAEERRARLDAEKTALQRRSKQVSGALDPGGAAIAERPRLTTELQAVRSRLSAIVNTELTFQAAGLSAALLREPAQLPTRPAMPNHPRMLALGALSGIAAGAVAAWRLETSSGRRERLAAAAQHTLVLPRHGTLEPAPAAVRPFRWFTPALALLLAGYMLLSRSFAYLSIPGTPLFVGEIVLGIGALEWWRARRLVRARLALSPPLLALAAFMLLCATRLLLDLPRYGIDAIRDSAIWYYAAYAWLVVAAVSTDPSFTARLAGWFRRLLPLFLLWVPLAVAATRVPQLGAFTVPGTGVPINSIKSGDLSVMAAIALGFLWLELERAAGRRPERRRDDVVSIVGVLALLALASQSRGGLLAVGTVLGTVLLLSTAIARRRAVLTCVAGALILLLPILALDVRVDIGGRELSVRQVTTNVASLIDEDASSGTEAETGLSGTLDWRKQYFETVLLDSLSPSHILAGQGFGPILSYRYIRNQSQAEGDAPLRNAHNSHLTILARTGLPGLVLWLVLLFVWLRYVLGVGRLGARGERHPDVAASVLAVAGVLGFAVLATTDPSLEGPQGGIWFWTLIGIGAAHAHAWRARQAAAGEAAAGEVAATDGTAGAGAVAAPAAGAAGDALPGRG